MKQKKDQDELLLRYKATLSKRIQELKTAKEDLDQLKSNVLFYFFYLPTKNKLSFFEKKKKKRKRIWIKN